MKIQVYKLHPLAQDLSYAIPGDSGADCASIEHVVIGPGERRKIRTGISLGLRIGYEAQIRSRSGLADKHGIIVLNSPGTIDSGYTGEIKVLLFNTSNEPFTVEPGMRIAQIVIAPVFTVTFVSVNGTTAQSDTVRGESGFGSTGV